MSVVRRDMYFDRMVIMFGKTDDTAPIAILADNSVRTIIDTVVS